MNDTAAEKHIGYILVILTIMAMGCILSSIFFIEAGPWHDIILFYGGAFVGSFASINLIIAKFHHERRDHRDEF